MTLPEEPKTPRCKAFDLNYQRLGKSKKQEKRLAGNLGGRRQAGSGSAKVSKIIGANVRGAASYGSKGDVKLDDFLMEAKRSDAASIRVEGEWLTKIDTEATLANKFPALAFEIGGMSKLTEKDWVAVPASVFNRLVRKG